MKQKLHEFVWQGSEINARGFAPLRVDFIAWDAERMRSFVFPLDWWKDLSTIDAEIPQVAGRFLLKDSEWVATSLEHTIPRVTLNPISDEDDAASFEKYRLGRQLEMPRYLDAVYALTNPGLFPRAIGVRDWFQFVAQQPVLTLGQLIAERDSTPRQAASVTLYHRDGKFHDVLAIDEHGAAATLEQSGWLEGFAEQWLGYSDETRPVPSQFLDWLLTQAPPQGAGYLENLEVMNWNTSISKLATVISEARLRA